jgi:recombination protein RecT
MATNLADLKEPRREPSTFVEKSAFLKGKIADLKSSTKHADRIIRTALVQMSQTQALLECSAKSIYQAICNAVSTGLEITGGQGYLVPYKGKCTFVPGWQGIVDLVSRTGRANVWAVAVFEGDEFEWALGDSPFVRHKPMGEDDPTKITHVYAIGRVKGSDWPNIEVWTMERVRKHLKKYNKVGARHYAYDNLEMYARKVVLLQVLKYMPKSQEVETALEASHKGENGSTYTIDGDGLVREVDEDGNASDPAPVVPRHDGADEGAPATAAQRETTDVRAHETTATQSQQVTEDPPVDAAKDKLIAAMRASKDQDKLDEHADLISTLPPADQAEANKVYRECNRALAGGSRPGNGQMAMSID